MKISGSQRKIILAGVLIFILLGLFPPWIYTVDARGISSEKPAGYSLIIEPPEPEVKRVTHGVRLDFSRLIVQWLVVAAATGAGFLLVGRKSID